MEQDETTNSSSSSVEDNNEIIPSPEVQFWTILIFQIPSLACTLYLLYHLLFKRHQRRALHNHVVIIMLLLSLVVELIDNSFYLDGWRVGKGNSFPSSSALCLLWWFIDYGFYGAITVFLTWASLERHILVFYSKKLLGTRRKTIFVHYVPLAVISIYLTGFYIGVIIFPPCENIFDFESVACGSSPCYQNVSWLNVWDYLINGTMCSLLETFFSVSLLIRAICSRKRTHRSVHWRKYRKMIIQLLSISTLSLIITLPQALITVVQQLEGMDDFGSQLAPYMFYLTTYVVLLLPFVCLGSLPELWPKLKLCRRRQRMIAPVIVTLHGGNLILPPPRSE